jgi:hypothetical protein
MMVRGQIRLPYAACFAFRPTLLDSVLAGGVKCRTGQGLLAAVARILIVGDERRRWPAAIPCDRVKCLVRVRATWGIPMMYVRLLNERDAGSCKSRARAGLHMRFLS